MSDSRSFNPGAAVSYSAMGNRSTSTPASTSRPAFFQQPYTQPAQSSSTRVNPGSSPYVVREENDCCACRIL